MATTSLTNGNEHSSKRTKINGNGTTSDDDDFDHDTMDYNGVMNTNGDKEERQLDLSEEVGDPFCDPENPKVITFNDVSAAAFKTQGGIIKTPCSLSQMSKQYDMKLYFKKDFLQYTGSFKERGARYVLSQLDSTQAKRGVIAASAGNHALGLSYHGRQLGIPVTVVMPITAPMMKVEACRQYGSNVIVVGNHFGEAKHYAMALGKQKDLLYVNGYDHPHILAGQGTMGLEIIEQVPHFDACIIPVGGGGLIAGSAIAIKALRPDCQIIGVESERSIGFQVSLAAGKPVKCEVGQTLADGLAVPLVGCNALATSIGHIDKMVTVKESSIALAILRLIEQEKAVVEGAGAAGLAAILEGLLPELKGKSVVVALCGGNIDTTALGRVIERGLAAEGRLVRFGVAVSDRPGGIAELAKRIADLGVSIKDILHERAWLQTDVFSVLVRCVVETRDKEHARELEREMRRHYTHVEFSLD